MELRREQKEKLTKQGVKLLRSEDKIILRDIIELRKIDLFYFHERYLLSPAQIRSAIDRLEKLGIAKTEKNFLIINEESVSTAIKYMRKIDKRPKYWRQLSNEKKYAGEKIEFYTPQDKR